MAEAAEGVDDPWERIRLRGCAYMRWGLANPEHYRILMMSRPDHTPDRFVDERLADTAGLVPVAADVAAAIDSERVILPDDPLEITKMLWMMIHGLVSLVISKPDFPFEPVDVVYGRLFELVHRGLVPHSVTPEP